MDLLYAFNVLTANVWCSCVEKAHVQRKQYEVRSSPRSPRVGDHLGQSHSQEPDRTCSYCAYSSHQSYFRPCSTEVDICNQFVFFLFSAPLWVNCLYGTSKAGVALELVKWPLPLVSKQVCKRLSQLHDACFFQSIAEGVRRPEGAENRNGPEGCRKTEQGSRQSQANSQGKGKFAYCS